MCEIVILLQTVYLAYSKYFQTTFFFDKAGFHFTIIVFTFGFSTYLLVQEQTNWDNM